MDIILQQLFWWGWEGGRAGAEDPSNDEITIRKLQFSTAFRSSSSSSDSSSSEDEAEMERILEKCIKKNV